MTTGTSSTATGGVITDEPPAAMAQSAAAPSGQMATAEQPYVPTSQAWTTVGVMTLFYVLSLMDRNILSLLIDPIKSDLRLTDIEVSLLYGAAFAIFYGLGALPLGWAVDRFARRPIVFGGVVLWSIATCMCGLSRHFGGLFAARSAVGVGEAAIVPAGQSLIADSFPPNKLSLPMAIYGSGTKLGAGISLVLGSALVAAINPDALFQVPVLGEMKGWQLIFIAAGLPGIFCAFLIFLIDEPPRRIVPVEVSGSARTYADYFRFFRVNWRFLIGVHLGALFIVSSLSAITTWGVPFLSRVHGWEISKAGFVLGPLLTIAPLLCVPIHGILVDRAFGRGIKDAHLRHLTYVTALASPFLFVAFWLPSAWMTLGLIMVAMMLTSSYVGLGGAVMALSVPATLRGKAASVKLLLVMVFGYSVGTSGPAIISDLVFKDPRMIGASASIYAGIGLALAALSFASARRAIGVHLANVN